MKTLAYVAVVIGVSSGVISPVFGQGITRLDTVYTPPGYEDGALVASIFIPDPAVARGIGVVLGHYLTGNRLTARVWCDTLAARGYTAMTIDYYDIGGPPYGLYPKPVRAFKIAIEFLRRNASRFGIRTDQIVGFGQSQGSLIWGETIIWENDDAYFRTDSTIDDHLNAAILLYGAYDNFKLSLDWENSMVAAYFSPDPSLRGTKGQCTANIANISTPLLLIHGTADLTLDIAHSRILRDSLVAHSRACELVEYNASGHGFDMTPDGAFTYVGLAAKDAVLSFLSRALPTVTVTPTRRSLDRNLDTVRVNVRVPNPAGLSFFLQIESPDEVPIDTLRLFDDGAHGDSLASDGIFANSWIPGLKNEYYLDLMSVLYDTVKFGELNNIKVFKPVTLVPDQESPLPTEFSLAQNYPNPFNPSTKIGYRVSGLGSSWVKLAVSDILGREVATLVNERKDPGTYEVTWDAAGFASGIYFCRMTAGPDKIGAGGFSETRKLMLIR